MAVTDAARPAGIRHLVGVLSIGIAIALVGSVAGCTDRNGGRPPVTTSERERREQQPDTTITLASLPPSTATAPAKTLAGRTIVIDPGHNEGNSAHAAEINQLVDVVTRRKPCDTSGTATNAGYSEASFNTDIARRLTELLRDEGAAVILTRGPNTPWGPCITERAAIGNRARADAAISIHADGGPAAGRGFHVIEPKLIPSHNDAIIGPSHRLALIVRDAFRDDTSMPTSNYLGRNGIDARDDLGGLNLSTVDKVFLECGNMRNNTDAALLSDPNWRQRAAAAVAAGLVAFLG